MIFFISASHAVVNNSLNDYEIIVGNQEINALMQIFKTNDVLNKEFTIFKIDGNTYEGDYSSSIKLKMVNATSEGCMVNEFTLKELMKMQTFVYSYLLPNNKDSKKVIKNAINYGYSILDLNRDSYRLIDKSLFLFGDIFVILEVLVIIVLIVYFALYSIKSIKNSNYQIGVFKSLGMKNSDIFSIFILKNMLFTFASLLITSLVFNPFFLLANYLLSLSFNSFSRTNFLNIKVFYFHFDIFCIVYFMIIVLFLIFTFIPLLITKNISPAKIVNNKEEIK